MGTAGFFECGALAVASLPLILRVVPPNRFYGMRTRLTLSSAEVWYAANEFTGWCVFAAAATSALIFWIGPSDWLVRSWISNAVFLIPLSVALVTSYARRWKL